MAINTNLDHEYLAIDVTGRKIYAIDPYDYRLLQFDIDRHSRDKGADSGADSPKD